MGGVQLKFSEENWDELLTNGTKLHKAWLDMVDRLADALLTLQKEQIPIIFRPYHEMNGDWFWWGGKPERFKALWTMLQDYLIKKKGVHNVLWAWTCDRPWEGVEAYYPGHEQVDLLGTDIYPLQGKTEVYPQEWYERMKAVAAGKPLALSEHSVLPSAELLEKQPWVYFMAWDNLVFRANTEEEIRKVYSNPRVKS